MGALVAQELARLQQFRKVYLRDETQERVAEFVRAQAGLCWRGVVESPLLGPAGNKEFLVLIEKVR